MKEQFIRFWMALSALGFFASLVLSIAGWAKVDVGLGAAPMLLHVGVFIVLIPTALMSGRDKRRHIPLAEARATTPKWIQIGVVTTFAYMFINFALFLAASRQYPKNGTPMYLLLRGFAGHWMMFYGISWVLLQRRLLQDRSTGPRYPAT